jgi:hypothetical protein
VVGGYGGGVSGSSGLKRKIGELTADKFKFETQTDVQLRAVQLLQEEWDRVKDSEARDRLLASYYDIFPRCLDDDEPEQCLRDILNLPTSGDVFRALRVQREMYTHYVAGPEEDIYPTTGFLGNFMSYTKHNMVPSPMYFWAGIAILGAACRRNFMVSGHNRSYRLSNYVLLTGPKGVGKSDAREVAIDVLERANRKVEELKNANDRRIRDLLTFQIPILGADVTAAGLVEKLAEHCGHTRHLVGPTGEHLPDRDGESVGIIDADELGGFLGKDSHAVGQKIPMLVEMAFKDSYHKYTKKGGHQDADNLALSILACTAPEWMHNTVVGDALSGGFLDRLLLIHRDEGHGNWKPSAEVAITDPVKAEKVADWLVELMLYVSDGYSMCLTREAVGRCNQWESEMKLAGRRDKDDAAKYSLPRITLHMQKVATLLCISEWDIEGPVPWIQRKHINQAIQILEVEEKYREEFMLQAEASSDEPTLKKMMAFIRARGGKVKIREFNSHGSFKRMDHVRRGYCIDALFSRGDLKLVEEGVGKKKTQFYVVTEDSDED